jgi:ubiquinone/menaquinone biosynthesis C-methylase UbiE
VRKAAKPAIEVGDELYGYDMANIYDLIYSGRGKDYSAESADVAQLVQQRKPDASSMLDVACGTGSHMVFLKEYFDTVEGVELSEHMIANAKSRIPDMPVHQGDMRDFMLDHTYDAVVCMFSSIGYLRSATELDCTLISLARHLTPGGVVVIEPWHFPEAFIEGYIADDLVKSDGLVVARVSHSARHGDHVPINVHYVVADRESGIQHFTDVHEMTLFTRKQYEAAFERAGCTVEYVKDKRFGCGLFVGVLK